MLLHFLSAAWYGDRKLNLPLPDHWDVSVVDVSLRFISKGLWPFRSGQDGSSKIVIAACPEGLGYHGLSLASLRGWSGLSDE